MGKLTLVYSVALLYGCVLDVYAASFVRLARSRNPGIEIDDRWLSTRSGPRVLELWSFGRDYLALLKSRTIWFPVVEILTAVCLTGVIALNGATLDALAATVLLTTVLLAAAVDLKLMIYPDFLSWPLIAAGVLFGLVAWPLAGPSAALDRLGGGAVGFVALWGIIRGFYLLTGKQGMGLGDVKMVGAIGFFVGLKSLLFFVWIFASVGIVTGLIRLSTHRISSDTPQPTGDLYVIGVACLLLFPSMTDRFLDLFEDVSGRLWSVPTGLAGVGASVRDGSFGAGARDVH